MFVDIIARQYIITLMKKFIINSALSNIDYIIDFLNINLGIDKNIFNDLKNKIPNLSDNDNNFLDKVSEKLDKIILDKISFTSNEINLKDFRLKSIFTFFNKTENNEEYYYPINLNNDRIIYPSLKNELKENDINLEKLKRDLENIDIDNINSIINLMANITSYIPYCSYNRMSYDISVYDQLKIKSALVSALYHYKNGFNYDNLDDNENYFALLSADISGIQKFIYTISSKGALKSLRARSFYLEILLEHIVDEILEKFKLFRFNLLYTGGGHFYIILPNLNNLSEMIKDIKDRINDWFINEFSIDLYIAMDIQEFSFNDLNNTKNIFDLLSQKLSKDKQKRYNKEQLKMILTPRENKSDFECSICHTSSKNTKERDNNLGYVCDICYNLYKAGKYLINEEDNIIIVSNKNDLDKESIVKMPSILQDSERYLYFGENCSNIVRVYSKNNLTNKNINLYLGNYNFKNNSSDLISFEELIENTDGINRIGVLRCDIDNLGQAFINGFGEYSDIFRTSSLSRHLSLFFKYYINFICKSDIGFNSFNLYGNEINFNKDKRIVIVYSGGDDVFLVGYWRDVINFAFDLRESFRKYTNNKLTFSAGIGFFNHKYPISKMAEQTGELEELAKSNKNYQAISASVPADNVGELEELAKNNKNDKYGEKDSISLFGIPYESGKEKDNKFDKSEKEKDNEFDKLEKEKKNKFKYCFNWEEFKFVTEKISKIFSLCYFDEKPDKNSIEVKDKVFFSISFMYRIKQLISSNDKINIVRLAYALGRIKSTGSEEYIKNYNDFKNCIYNWILDEKKYLNTALDLIIYLHRDDSKHK